MTPELMDMLRNERMRLEAELKAMTTYRRLEAVAAMLEAYDDEPSAHEEKADSVAPAETETAPAQSVDDYIASTVAAAGPNGISAMALSQAVGIGYDPMLRRLKGLVVAGRVVKVNNGVNGTAYIAPPEQSNEMPSERIERTLTDAGENGIKATALRAVADLEPTSFKAMMDALIAEGAVKRAGDRYYRIVSLQPNGAQA